MKSFGADVSIVGPDSATLLDANEVAYRRLLSDMQSSFYVANSIVGPHPYPTMVREFQTVIGMEVKQQIMSASGALPDHLIAYAAGGSNALGLFYPFLDTEIALSGVESSGSQGEQPTRLRDNRPGIYQGTKTLMRQDGNGQLMASESLAVGLQASLLGPEYSHLLSTGRINCESVSDKEALNACALGQELEDITFSLESAHAIARGLQLASDLQADKTVVINVSGRGEKDAALISGEQL
jgi:tryptophan synthase beta chain